MVVDRPITANTRIAPMFPNQYAAVQQAYINAGGVFLQGDQYVKFPDGEVIKVQDVSWIGQAQNTNIGTIAGTRAIWVVPPYLTQAQVDDWIELNYLMRPPLTDDEIMLLPVKEAISLYYSLRKISPPCSAVPDPIVSAGLGGGRFGIEHELNLQNRIRALRQDLLEIQQGKNTYRILVDPSFLDPPSCPSSGLGMSIGGIIADFIPIVGWVYAAASVAYSVVDQITVMQHAQWQQNMINEVTTGIRLAEANLPNPAPDPVRIANLKRNYINWLRRINEVTPMAEQINIQAVHANDPIALILNKWQGKTSDFNPYSNVGLYTSQWKPFSRYFFSQSVYQMVFPVESQTAAAAPVAAGLGIGAALLLLL